MVIQAEVPRLEGLACIQRAHVKGKGERAPCGGHIRHGSADSAHMTLRLDTLSERKPVRHL